MAPSPRLPARNRCLPRGSPRAQSTRGETAAGIRCCRRAPPQSRTANEGGGTPGETFPRCHRHAHGLRSHRWRMRAPARPFALLCRCASSLGRGRCGAQIALAARSPPSQTAVTASHSQRHKECVRAVSETRTVRARRRSRKRARGVGSRCRCLQSCRLGRRFAWLPGAPPPPEAPRAAERQPQRALVLGRSQ